MNVTGTLVNQITETHLVVLFDNQLDRDIKVVPSCSSRGFYQVEPRGYLQVNITADSKDSFKEIVFKAYDKKENIVLLNNNEYITLRPSFDKGFVNHVTITPPGMTTTSKQIEIATGGVLLKKATLKNFIVNCNIHSKKPF